jgi:hypothetical protein
MMIRSFVRHAPSMLACAALIFAAEAFAQAAVNVPVAVSATVPIQVLGTNCTGFTPGGTPSAPTLTCITGGPPPLSCVISGAPASAVAIGTPVTLTGSCSGGTAPYSYSWSPGGSTSASISANTGSAGTTTYTMTGRDAANGSSSPQAAVTVSGGGGGGGPISCPGFNNTVVVDLDWNNPQRGYANVGPNDAIVVRITPNNVPTSSSNLTGAEYGSGPAQRVGIMATAACDFTTPPALGWGAASYGTTVYLPFTNGPNNTFYYPGLPVGTPLFVNVKTTSCPAGTCNMYFDLFK